MSPIKTVVLADPHVLLRKGVRQLLESTGRYEILASVDGGGAAIDFATTLQPDILVVSASFPDIDPNKFVTQLKHASPRAKIVVYTFVGDERCWLELLASGIDAIVLKSDGEDQLLSALAAVSVGKKFFSSAMPQRLFEIRRSRGPISPREQEIVHAVASGMTNAQVGRLLGISVKTVDTHRASASAKLNCRTTADLVRYAVRNELIAA